MALAICTQLAVADLQISDVRHDRVQFYPSEGEQLSIAFKLTESANMVLNIYDGRDLLIRSICRDKRLSAGKHELVWDGKDEAGRQIPAGAYHYTLVATGAAGEQVEHDLTDLTGGEDLGVKDIRWDAEKGEVHYVLPGLARVTVRIGLANGGPLLRTLINWVPRRGGLQTQPWDGKDESGVLDLGKHPKVAFGAQAFSLSDNTVLVGHVLVKQKVVDELSWGEKRREVKRVPRKRMHAHAQQPFETRGDFSIELKLPDGLDQNKAGVPIVSGVIPVRLDIDDKDRARALARRFEPVFYLDGVFVFENETGFLPMTWNWDSTRVNPGTHYLTANLRGYEGNFGIVTIKVDVRKQEGKVGAK